MPAAWNTSETTSSPAAIRAQLEASCAHAEALARLDFLASNHLPLGLVIGPAGCGKSAVLGEFARRAARQGLVVVQASLAGADETMLLCDLASGLAASVGASTAQTWRSISERLVELTLEALHTIVLLDDLDRAPPAALALVERLLSLDRAPISIAASARPETVGRLGAKIVEHAALRIDLSPWSETETAEYLARRPAVSSTKTSFEATAARRLFELSAGAPRKVNQLALLAEIASAGQDLASIDEETIFAVHEELTAAR